jgi:hypothetical protein
MKLGIIISAVAHAVLLSYGLIYLSAPPSHEAVEIEALPVDIIPVSSITQIQRGEKKAPVAEAAAPRPTERPDRVEDAQNVGDNKVDLTSSKSESTSERVVESAVEPPKAERAEPVPTPEKAPVQQAEKPEPVPATEVAALPKPQQEVAPDPVADTIARSEPGKPEFELPKSVPTPTQRPTPPKAQTAKTPERKINPDRKENAKLASAQNSEFNADEIQALLNRDDPAGGGAQRSHREAALGGQTTTTGQKLTQSEMDALRGQIQRCWLINPGLPDADKVHVKVTMRLDRSGAVEGQPNVHGTGASDQVRRHFTEGAMRAVLRCAPYNLPAEKYDTWADVVVNFSLDEML